MHDSIRPHILCCVEGLQHIRSEVFWLFQKMAVLLQQCVVLQGGSCPTNALQNVRTILLLASGIRGQAHRHMLTASKRLPDMSNASQQQFPVQTYTQSKEAPTRKELADSTFFSK